METKSPHIKSRPPPANSRSLREQENNSRQSREGFASKKTILGSLAEASRRRKQLSAVSRRLREGENNSRQPRGGFANEKTILGSLAEASRTRKQFLAISRRFREGENNSWQSRGSPASITTKSNVWTAFLNALAAIVTSPDPSCRRGTAKKPPLQGRYGEVKILPPS